MTGLLSYADFRAIRDDHARAFCIAEIETLTPLYATLEANMLMALAVYQDASKRDKHAALDTLKEAGFTLQPISARLNAARDMLARLDQRGEQNVSHD